MRILKATLGLASLTLAAAFVGCDDGESSNPATKSRSELNSPGNLITLTKPASEGIDLYWTNANAEEDFVGYYVFAAKASLDGVQAKAAFPTSPSVSLADKAQIPRCTDNDALFAMFGLDASGRDCESDAEEEPDTDSETGFRSASGLQAMAEGDEEDDGDSIEIPANFVPCTTGSSETLSYAAEPNEMGTVTCNVKKAYDGTALVDLVDGEKYVFFVVAVAGDEQESLSWTSNFVEDSPSKTAYSDELTIAADEFVRLAFNTTTNAVTVVADQPCPTPHSDANSPCAVTGTNGETDDGIYIARDARSADNAERVFISASSAGNFDIDLITHSSEARLPGDEPFTGTYSSQGTKVTAHDNAVFGFKWTNGTKVHYGKIAFGKITYDGTSVDATATVPVTVVLQTGAGVPHFFRQ